MKKLIALAALVVFPTLIFSQTAGKISGTIVGEDGTPLVGANVLLVGTSYGAATNEEGMYYVLDVPVGTYSIRAEYIGYKSMTIENIRVNADLTTKVDFALEIAAVEGESVTVTADRPIINKNATNTNRIIETEVIEALPLRNVNSVVDLQTGVVDGHVRGGRSGDNAYYYDGVLIRNAWNGGNFTGAINRSSTEEISVQSGGFTAEYGNANGGVISVVSKTGANKYSGSFEFVSDIGSGNPGTDPDALYSYGYNLLNFDVGGPITNRMRFYLNIEQVKRNDSDPSLSSFPYADVSEFTSLTAADSANIWVDGIDSLGLKEGNVYFNEVVKNNQSNPDSLQMADQNEWLGKGEIDSIRMYHPDWLDTTYVLVDNYNQYYGPKRNNENEKLTVSGNLVFDLKPLRLKVGGTMFNYAETSYDMYSQMLNWNNMPKFDSFLRLGYINGTFTLSPKSFVRTTLSMKRYNNEEYNSHWGDDIEAYGKRTTDIGSPNYYFVDHGLNVLTVQPLVGFDGYGAQWGRYIKRSENTLGLRSDYVNQFNVHELKAGVEYYSTEIRYYSVSQAREIYGNIAKLDTNFNGQVDQEELSAYDDIEDWRYNVYRNAYTYNIGYNIFGEETDEYKQSDHSQEPGQAKQTHLYMSDKIELSDVVLNLGLSFESFNPNTYAPDSDGDGTGDDQGFDNIHMVDGRIDRSGEQTGSYKWEPVETYTDLMPRIGFAFPVTDQTVFHAQYGRYWQAPPLVYLYLSDSRLAANLSQGNQTASPNPALKPEKTTSYEIGFVQQIGQSAALDITGFYKEVRDYLMLQNRNDDGTQSYVDGSEFSWAQYRNGDFGVTQGFAFNIRMRRVQGFMADFNYSMMWARGTGSDPLSNWNITWTGTGGESYPTMINRLDYDQRHTGSLMVDYRSPSRSGLFADLGANVLFTFGSGQAYTPSEDESAVYGRGWYTPVAAVNSGDMPWSSRLDLRVDKGLTFGGVKLNAYILVLNALNTENANDVYQTTGLPDEDGWLETPAGQEWLQSQQSSYPNVPSRSIYQTRINGPQAFGDPQRIDIPRTMRFGIEVGF